jgi:hypothetical protein
MVRQFLLVHSPLLGPYSWAPVADLLRAEGHRVATPDLRSALTGPPPYYPRLCDAAVAAAGIPAGDQLTLVGHSAAGPILPAITEAIGAAVADVVFMDARLPYPGSSWLSSITEERAAQLNAMATDGVLPPWDTWFPAEMIVLEVPDPDVRERFTADIRPMPFALCAETAPSSTPVFDGIPCSYVQLSKAYDADAEAAKRAGWHVVRADSVHLAPLSHPDEVVAALHQALPPENLA